MTQKIAINSLVLDFKRDNEGKGVQGTQALTALVAFSLAYTVPCPDNGKFGSSEAVQAFLTPVLKNMASTVNELYNIDIGTVVDLTTSMYCNRYDNIWGGRRALEAFSSKQILDETYGLECYPTVLLWVDRFVDAVAFYINQELQG